MKYITIAFAFLISLQLSAQNAVEKYFSNHLDNQEATVVQVSGKMFQYASHFVPENIEDEDMPVKNAKEVLGNIQSFVLVKVDSLNNSRKEYKNGIQLLENKYEELIRVTDKENNFSLFIDESNDVIHEIVGVVSTGNEFIVAALVGEMKLDHIQDIIAKVQSEQIESIMESADVNIGEMKVYPNPASADTGFSVDVPTKMIGGVVNVYNAAGVKVHTQSASESNVKINTELMTSGQYYIEIQNAGVVLKKKVILMQ